MVASTKKSKKQSDDGIIRIGNKPPMSYVLALVSEFSKSDAAVIQARGRAISRAVDVAEITRNRFVKNLLVDDITIATEQVTQKNGKALNVSSIEIALSKPK